MAKRNDGGRKRHITLEVVQRVSQRVAKGLTLALACASENDPCINPDSWEKALKRNPEFVAPYHKAKADFLEKAVNRLAEADDLVNLRWLLSRRHSDLFAEPVPTVNVSQSVIGLAEADLKRAREKAAKL